MAINRADLINQLAASMGAGEYAPTKYENSRFNAETGTLYCNGNKVSKSVAEQAINHFTQMKNRCKANDLQTKQMAAIYQCAIDAIKTMQDPAVKSLLQAQYSDKAAV
ncbi:hypothetical protein [Butyrivibrio sp. VCB2006]|uniref:hypothetical protein n=1 Tax=Butyrivibrio sp. VCB2006 TaxID=1280679 RepID=UPI0009DBBDC0|nr:hypothetical protein [Butyrivibrio sp. VCB2006]